MRAGAPVRELAGRLTDADIAAHLYTAGRTDPYLIIRTSGERRLSGSLLWQSTRSLLHFCDRTGPASVGSTCCAPCAPTPIGARKESDDNRCR